MWFQPPKHRNGVCRACLRRSSKAAGLSIAGTLARGRSQSETPSSTNARIRDDLSINTRIANILRNDLFLRLWLVPPKAADLTPQIIRAKSSIAFALREAVPPTWASLPHCSSTYDSSSCTDLWLTSFGSCLLGRKPLLLASSGIRVNRIASKSRSCNPPARVS